MNRQQLPRREFLMQALMACGAPLFVEVTHAQSTQKPQPQITLKRGTQVAASYFGVGDGDALRAIGTAYLKQAGVEADEPAIVATAADTLQLIARSATEAAAITALTQAVRRDFREQRTVQIEGWIISRTEAHLCALALLAQ
jgi:hypothetical protein